MQLRVLLASALCLALALPVLALAGGAAAPAALPGCDEAAVVAAGLVPSHEVSAVPCPGIRPGGALVLPAGPLEMVYCSMAFIVTDGTDLYVSTAGHCVDASLGVPGLGQRVSALGVGEFGTVAYQWCEGGDSLGNGCAPGTDFALVRVDTDKHAHVSAAMCGWGAPSGGVYEGSYLVSAGDPLLVQHFGWGMGVAAADLGVNWLGVHVQPANPATQPREGLLVETDPRSTGGVPNVALVETVAFSGDSGSGVMVTGLPDPLTLEAPAPQALGVMTHISVGGVAFVQRLDASLERAGADMGKTFTLVAA